MKENDKSASVSLDRDTSLQLAALFREGTTGLAELADACNNIDSKRVPEILKRLNEQLTNQANQILKAAGGQETIGGRKIIARLPHGMDIVK